MVIEIRKDFGMICVLNGVLFLALLIFLEYLVYKNKFTDFAQMLAFPLAIFISGILSLLINLLILNGDYITKPIRIGVAMIFIGLCSFSLGVGVTIPFDFFDLKNAPYVEVIPHIIRVLFLIGLVGGGFIGKYLGILLANKLGLKNSINN